ncbi:steroid 17-alpha-hydroxylase/17,20 lyase-like [Orbicella faveolata]|uniref:steroid 17-alpha-hydroxylase/17,20 lyase-like n=1 Tax=Orbicella faveolata TaxID=48498 RepID=UPI0009E2581C|nr:steroid 17-alpha-hydroxylase/17,20 lyase-like [Orbicella faveolata]
MELLLSEYFTLGNIFLAIVFLLILNQLIELYQFRNMPPGPRLTSLPFIGNLLSFDAGESLREATTSMRKKYGAVYSMKVGSFKLVVAEDADSVKEVLVKKSADYAGRPPFHSLVMTTLGGKDIAFANYGPGWKFHRKLFMAAVRKYLSTEIQNQLDEVVGRDRMPGLDDRPHLPLVQATIMEALRLGNVAEAALPHYTLKDTSLAGYRVPKDTVVLVNLMNVHLDPNCWENPNSFNPRRHIDADGQLITNSGNFLPFSAGRRICAGEALAKVELFLFLSWMLHKFTFLPSKEGNLPDLKGVDGFTRSPAPYRIRVEKRN